MKKLNKKFIFIFVGVLVFSCIVYLLLKKKTPSKKENLIENISKNIQNEKNALNNNLNPKKNNSVSSLEINFSSNNLATISECIEGFRGTSPTELHNQLLSSEDFKKYNQRTNYHFKTKDNQMLQQRIESTNNQVETYLYILKNNLPILTKKSLSSFGEIKKTYEDNQRKYFSASSQLDFVSINGKIVKLDFQNKKATLSCDLFEKREWNCNCVL